MHTLQPKVGRCLSQCVQSLPNTQIGSPKIVVGRLPLGRMPTGMRDLLTPKYPPIMSNDITLPLSNR